MVFIVHEYFCINCCSITQTPPPLPIPHFDDLRWQCFSKTSLITLSARLGKCQSSAGREGFSWLRWPEISAISQKLSLVGWAWLYLGQLGPTAESGDVRTHIIRVLFHPCDENNYVITFDLNFDPNYLITDGWSDSVIIACLIVVVLSATHKVWGNVTFKGHQLTLHPSRCNIVVLSVSLWLMTSIAFTLCQLLSPPPPTLALLTLKQQCADKS